MAQYLQAPLCSGVHTWMVKVKLSSAGRCSLVVVEQTVEALLTDNLHTTVRLLGVGCALAERRDDLLTNRRLAQHQQQHVLSTLRLVLVIDVHGVPRSNVVQHMKYMHDTWHMLTLRINNIIIFRAT